MAEVEIDFQNEDKLDVEVSDANLTITVGLFDTVLFNLEQSYSLYEQLRDYYAGLDKA